LKGEGWILAVAMLLPTAAAAVAFIGFSAGDVSDPQANPLLQIGYATCKVVQFSLPVVWLAIVDRAALRPRRPSARGLLTGVLFGIAVASLVFALYFGFLAGSPMFDGVGGRVRAKAAEFGAATPVGFLVLAAFLSIIHSALEEYYWRWFVYGRLRRHVPQVTGLALAGLAFMSHHIVIIGVYFPQYVWSAVLPFSLGVAGGGIVWAWLYERTGSLLGPWVSHMIVDAAVMIVGFDLVFDR
jgi:membrane protease YdiL (CAAX protease family)